MLIAIDFDDTLTADPMLWNSFVTSARANGHRCICVTARRQTEENIETLDSWLSAHNINLPVYFTSLGSKTEHMRDLGVAVDIWIDDNPHALVNGH